MMIKHYDPFVSHVLRGAVQLTFTPVGEYGCHAEDLYLQTVHLWACGVQNSGPTAFEFISWIDRVLNQQCCKC